jgi:hypothetical protein
MTTVTGTFTDAAGDPGIGYVRFQPRTIREVLSGGGGIVTPTRITVPLDGYGSLVQDLEPGDYNIVIVLQGTRNIYGAITVPDSDISTDLSKLLSQYTPTLAVATAKFGVAGAFEFSIPYWVNAIDYLLIGGGGRGGDSKDFSAGQGAQCGTWTTGTLVRGTDFRANTDTLLGNIGAGGSTATSGVGADGEVTTLNWVNLSGDDQSASAAGGVGGGRGSVKKTGNTNKQATGIGAPNKVYLGVTYDGGPDVVKQAQPGSWPGGGGSGGAVFWTPNGGAGAAGGAILVGRRTG